MDIIEWLEHLEFDSVHLRQDILDILEDVQTKGRLLNREEIKMLISTENHLRKAAESIRQLTKEVECQ